jgi:hypothetical protein
VSAKVENERLIQLQLDLKDMKGICDEVVKAVREKASAVLFVCVDGLENGRRLKLIKMIAGL